MADLGDALELVPEIHEPIKRLCADGDGLAECAQYEAVIAAYNSAWKLVPEPKNEWEASTWILAAIADAGLLGGYRTSAFDALRFVMTCPGAIGNPFLHLRYGQVLFDRQEFDRASTRER